MTWVKLPNTFAEDPRWQEAGADAFALHVAALCYCDRNLTDGLLPKVVVPRICLAVPVERTTAAATALVEHGLWVETDAALRAGRLPGRPVLQGAGGADPQAVEQ